MSFAYKILNPSDITISPYTANKLYTFASSSLTEYGIVVYSGEYEPIINVSCSDGPATGQVPCNPYNPETDVTSNGYARRLIYDSIQKLYYQSFISGGFSNVLWVSSSYDNYLQTALTSGSNFLTNIRIFGQDSGSGGYYYNYSSSIYDTGSYPSDPSLIRVISIPQDIFGSGIKPGTFEISSSNYLIQDDGQGNLMDNISITSSLYAGTDYIANVYGATPDRQGVHVGNIIYSHGMIIITNEDYFCFYPSEPVAQNNYFSVLNVQPTKSLAVLTNDFDDCAELDTGSLSIVAPLAGYNFPDNTAVNGYINIGPTTSNLYQVTPGLYKGYYYVSNSAGVPSNYATVSLEIYASPLQLNVLSYTLGCFNTVASQSVTYSINYGVPPYSWSLNETTSWDGISNLYQPTQSLSVASTTNVLYIKDAVGEIVSQSINVVYNPILYSYTTQSILCAGGTGSITVTTASSDAPVSVALSPSGPWYTTYPKLFNGITADQILYFTNSLNCSTSSVNIPFNDPDPIIITSYTSSGDCDPSSGGNVGALFITASGGVPPYNYYWFNTGSSWCTPISPAQNTAHPVGLDSGSYVVWITDQAGTCNSSTSSIIPISSSFPIVYSTASSDVSCYGGSNASMSVTASNGLGTVTASLYSGSYLSTVYLTPATSYSVIGTGLKTGSYSLDLEDGRGCTVTVPVTINGPAAPFDADLNVTGALYIYKPSLYDPYTAQFSLHGGNYTNYNVTLSVKTQGSSFFVPAVSGTFAGSSGTSSISMPVSGICLDGPTSWSLTATDNKSCSLNNENLQNIYILPEQVHASLIQYLPTGSTAPGNNPQNACTASFVNLYFTSSEAPNGIDDLIDGDHIWTNCDLTTSASGYIVSGSYGVIAPIYEGVFNPDGIYFVPSCAPVTPPNKFWCLVIPSTWYGTAQVDNLMTHVGYSLETNGVVTSSVTSVLSYPIGGQSSYVNWSGTSSYYFVENSIPSSSYWSISGDTDFAMPTGPQVTLYRAPSGSSTLNDFVLANDIVFQYDGAGYCYTNNSSYFDNLYGYGSAPVSPVLFDPTKDYMLVVALSTYSTDPSVCI